MLLLTNASQANLIVNGNFENFIIGPNDEVFTGFVRFFSPPPNTDITPLIGHGLRVVLAVVRRQAVEAEQEASFVGNRYPTRRSSMIRHTEPCFSGHSDGAPCLRSAAMLRPSATNAVSR
jgi:hypothetical protein